ncbi:alpha/beta fold hydrolase [Streptomyces cucumeris]|uniref:alpha/beta fold hydrolase n=1 Tax=Streptomyces cucumeris TaxID=2962890 RepID=UPI003EBCE75F
MSEKIVDAGELKLWSEDFGDPAAPAVLLITGGNAQAIGWPDSLCHGLAADGRYVIRYDHRNTGKSSLVDLDKAPYDCHDLARDAVAVLDAYGVDTAHVVGLSLGGLVAQLMALDHRPRVSSLTLVSTSSALAANPSALTGRPLFFTPPPHPRFLEQLAALNTELTATPPTTREALIEARFRMYAFVAGTTEYDLGECRRTLTREFDRAIDPMRPDPSGPVLTATAAMGDLAPRLRTLDVPTLVIHGVDDPIVPVEHGRALAETIPGAQSLFLGGYGHALPNAAVVERWREVMAHFTGTV